MFGYFLVTGLSLCVRPSHHLCASQEALQKLGLPPTDHYINDIFRQYDIDGDGVVHEREFRSYVQRKEAAMRRAFR